MTLPVFRGNTVQRGYGLGGLFKGLFTKAVPLLTSTAKVAGTHLLESALKETGVKRKALNVNKKQPMKKPRIANKKSIKAKTSKRKRSQKVPANVVEAF